MQIKLLSKKTLTIKVFLCNVCKDGVDTSYKIRKKGDECDEEEHL